MNSENRKTCNCKTLILNLSDKISLKSRDKHVAIPSLSIYNTCNIKSIHLKYQLYHKLPDG